MAFIESWSAGRLGFDTPPVVDRVAELLLASEVTLGGLDGDVPGQELDLIQLAAGEVAQLRESTSEVVRSKRSMPALDAASRSTSTTLLGSSRGPILLKIDTVSQNDAAIECEARL